MGVICIIFLICALRVNVCFVVIFLTLALAFMLLTGAYWVLASDYAGNAAMAGKLLVVRYSIITSALTMTDVVSITVGRRGLPLRYLRRRVVDLLRHHARNIRLSYPGPRGRLEWIFE